MKPLRGLRLPRKGNLMTRTWEKSLGGRSALQLKQAQNTQRKRAEGNTRAAALRLMDNSGTEVNQQTGNAAAGEMEERVRQGRRN